MKQRTLFLLLTFSFLSCSETTWKEDIPNTVRSLFGRYNTDLPTPSLLFLEDLLHELAASSDYQIMKASEQAAPLLWKLYEERAAAKEDEPDEENRAYIDHALFIFEIQAEHFERTARIIDQELSWLNRCIGWIHNLFQTLINYGTLPNTSITNPIEQLASHLFDYAQLERAEIFNNYRKTAIFMVVTKRHKLPLVLRFWDYPGYQHQLLTGVRMFENNVIPLAALEVVGETLEESMNLFKNWTGETVEAAFPTADAATATSIRTAISAAANFLKTAWKAITYPFRIVIYDGTQTTATLSDQAVNDLLAPIRTGITTIGKVTDEAGAATDAFVQYGGEIYDIPTTALNQGEMFVARMFPKAEIIKFNSVSNAMKALKTMGANVAIAATAATTETAAIESLLQKINSPTTQLAKTLDPFVKAKQEILGNIFSKMLQDAKGTTGMQNAGKSLDSVLVQGKGIPPEVSNWLKGASSWNKGVYYVNYYMFKLLACADPISLLSYLSDSAYGKMLLMFVDQAEIMTSGQMVEGWASEANAQAFAALVQQQSTLATSLTSFFSDASKTQQAAIQAIQTQFTYNISQIATQFSIQSDSSGNLNFVGALPTLLAAEQAYVTNNLINTTIKQVYLQNQIPDDELFANAAMANPAAFNTTTQSQQNDINYTWYNINRYGNWEFSPVNYATGVSSTPVTSFVQYNNIPLSAEKFANGDPNRALKNSIFIDYIPTKRTSLNPLNSYTITIQVILLAQPSTPFMLGILFNGARWIPGVYDFYRQHRLFCIYSAPSQQAGTQSVGFGESFYQSATSSSQSQLSNQGGAVYLNISAISPTYQILVPDSLALAKLTGVTPINNPIATIPALTPGVPYTFTIQTQPTQVTLSITDPNNTTIYPATSTTTQPSSPGITPGQFTNLNQLFYLYHNIGFIAAGCSAQFIIQSPAEIQYTPTQVQAIATTLSSGGSS